MEIDVNEILARELFVMGGGESERGREFSRDAWEGLTPTIRKSWLLMANQLRLALAADGVFVMRSRDV